MEMTNLNPSLVLGTPLTAAPVLGICGSIFLITTGLLYSNRQVRLARERGEHYTPPPGAPVAEVNREKLPHAWKGFLITGILMRTIIIGGHLVENTTLLIVCAVSVCSVICYVLHYDVFKSLDTPQLLTEGVESAVPVVASLAAVLGFAGVVQSTDGFNALLNGLLALDIPVYIKVSLYTAIISGTLGSSASGSRVAILSMSDYILSSGANLEVVHRLTAMASITVDTLPHFAGAFAQLRVLNLTHKESYKYMFHLTVLQTGAACKLATIAAIMFY